LRDPWQAGPLTDEGIAAVQYALFAWVTANLFVELRLRRPLLAVATTGVLAAFGLGPARSSSDLMPSAKMRRFARPP
jgi:hypothetical protein